MTTPVSRRAVLRGLAIGATSPVWLRFAEPFAAADAGAPMHHLLVVFLRGGNDPLATIAPLGNSALTKLRPKLAMTPADAFALGNGYGISKQLPTLFSAWKAGQLAVVQQVGTSGNNLSHTIATRRTESGSPDDRFNSGWLGRYLDATTPRGAVRAAGFSEITPLSLAGDTEALTLESLADFAFVDADSADAALRRDAQRRMAAAPAAPGSMLEAVLKGQRELLTAMDPVAKLGSVSAKARPEIVAADNAARLFAADVGTEIAFISVGSFDTHAAQRSQHGTAIARLDAVAKQFFATATKLGVAERSSVLVVSEFGRRVYENRSGGTDHGNATTLLLLGPRVAGGMYGPKPDFSQLEDGNLRPVVDLRSVYASIVGGWFGTDPARVLGGTFPTLPLFR